MIFASFPGLPSGDANLLKTVIPADTKAPDTRSISALPLVMPKRCKLLFELVSQAGIALLANPNGPTAERIIREVQQVAWARSAARYLEGLCWVRPTRLYGARVGSQIQDR